LRSFDEPGGNPRPLPLGGRGADGAPRVDQPVPPGGYLWWYFDALSDDGRHGLTVIAFVGSVFSPYYALARSLGHGDPDNFCALNVALYGEGGKRWAMTERGRGQVSRSRDEYTLGPSRVRWDGRALVVDIDEIGVPIPRRIRGRVRVEPEGLCRFIAPLDEAGRHHWGPIAPCARIEVELEQPRLRWRGHAYLDSNEGSEPVDRAFIDWDWSRATMAGGDTAVIYDVRPRQGGERVIAQRFGRDGSARPFEAPPRHRLPTSMWRIPRQVRGDAVDPPQLLATLEDTPFYVRSKISSTLLGERLTSIHETLDVPRVVSLPVRLMLPWRMPRRP
jgi:carotenoid 1,2-hydratase